ncbi:MAG: Lipopolysaccharide assembly protein B [Pyrinomonadaceae bacterium]|nr:Lipopolysaccharide assembly protein B [Pyrinomonadaceae bacterium]
MASLLKLYKKSMTAAVILIFAIAAFPVTAQDLVPVSNISGGSSVFVFRKSSAPRRFTSNVKATRSREQRTASAKRVRKQYETHSAETAKTTRSAVVSPDKAATAVRTMKRQEASKVLAGSGEFYLQENDLDNAVDSFREAVTLDATNTKAKLGLSDALARKGNSLLDGGKSPLAKSFFLEAIKYDAKNAAAYFGLGELFADDGDNGQALANYEKALAADPRLTEIYQPLGILYYQQGEIAKADTLLGKALALDPNSAETQVFVAAIRLAQNRNQEALDAAKKALTIDPNSADAANTAGDALVRLGRVKDAIQFYEKATTLRQNYFDALLALGDAYLETGDYPNAVKAYSGAFRAKNTSPEAAEGLADAYRLSGDFNSAAGAYRNALTFMDRDATYSNAQKADTESKLAFVIGQQCTINIRQAKRCEWPSAIAAMEKAVKLGNGSAIDYANLGWAYYNAAQIDNADKKTADAKAKTELARIDLEKALAMNPTFAAGPMLNLGMVRTDLGDYAGAADILSKVVKEKPEWAFAWNELGLANYKLNNKKEAVDNYKRATDEDPNLAAAWFNLGRTSIELGNMNDAKKAYKKLVSLRAINFANFLELMSKGAVKK